MTILEAVHLLDALIDESDPDTDLPNSVHAFQTAERIRADHPGEDWFHLTGLIHDLGKVMALWGEPQYCVVGDTFPVGCRFSQEIVFPETFKANPDTQVPEYRYVCDTREINTFYTLVILMVSNNNNSNNSNNSDNNDNNDNNDSLQKRAVISSLLLVARNILSGGMSAPHAHQQQQQFQTYTDVNQCLHNKSSSHGVPNVNLFDFIFLLVDYGKVLCSLANNLQQN